MQSVEIVCLCYLLVHLVYVAEHLLILVEILRKFAVVLLCPGDIFLHYQVFLNSLLLERVKGTILGHYLLSRAFDHLLKMRNPLAQLHQFLALGFLLQCLYLLYDFLKQRNHFVVGLTHDCRLAHAELLLLPSEGVHHFHQKSHSGELLEVLNQPPNDFPTGVTLQCGRLLHQLQIFLHIRPDQSGRPSLPLRISNLQRRVLRQRKRHSLRLRLVANVLEI